MTPSPGDTGKAKGAGPTEMWLHSTEPGNIRLPLAPPGCAGGRQAFTGVPGP